MSFTLVARRILRSVISEHKKKLVPVFQCNQNDLNLLSNLLVQADVDAAPKGVGESWRQDVLEISDGPATCLFYQYSTLPIKRIDGDGNSVADGGADQARQDYVDSLKTWSPKRVALYIRLQDDLGLNYADLLCRVKNALKFSSVKLPSENTPIGAFWNQYLSALEKSCQNLADCRPLVGWKARPSNVNQASGPDWKNLQEVLMPRHSTLAEGTKQTDVRARLWRAFLSDYLKPQYELKRNLKGGSPILEVSFDLLLDPPAPLLVQTFSNAHEDFGVERFILAKHCPKQAIDCTRLSLYVGYTTPEIRQARNQFGKGERRTDPNLIGKQLKWFREWSRKKGRVQDDTEVVTLDGKIKSVILRDKGHKSCDALGRSISLRMQSHVSRGPSIPSSLPSDDERDEKVHEKVAQQIANYIKWHLKAQKENKKSKKRRKSKRKKKNAERGT